MEQIRPTLAGGPDSNNNLWRKRRDLNPRTLLHVSRFQEESEHKLTIQSEFLLVSEFTLVEPIPSYSRRASPILSARLSVVPHLF